MMNITWMQRDVPTEILAHWLTTVNFQPGKFHLISSELGITTVVYVDSEHPMSPTKLPPSRKTRSIKKGA